MSGNSMSIEIIEKVRAAMPPLFAGVEVDRLTGNALRWRTLQNMKCRGELPSELFIRHGRKLLLDRDVLLDWWKDKLQVN